MVREKKDGVGFPQQNKCNILAGSFWSLEGQIFVDLRRLQKKNLGFGSWRGSCFVTHQGISDQDGSCHFFIKMKLIQGDNLPLKPNTPPQQTHLLSLHIGSDRTKPFVLGIRRN